MRNVKQKKKLKQFTIKSVQNGSTTESQKIDNTEIPKSGKSKTLILIIAKIFFDVLCWYSSIMLKCRKHPICTCNGPTTVYSCFLSEKSFRFVVIFSERLIYFNAKIKLIF